MPRQNIAEAALVSRVELISAGHLLDVCAHLCGKQVIQPDLHEAVLEENVCDLDFADVHGQFHVKRACEIAAAGQHNLLTLCI